MNDANKSYYSLNDFISDFYKWVMSERSIFSRTVFFFLVGNVAIITFIVVGSFQINNNAISNSISSASLNTSTKEVISINKSSYSVAKTFFKGICVEKANSKLSNSKLVEDYCECVSVSIVNEMKNKNIDPFDYHYKNEFEKIVDMKTVSCTFILTSID